MVLRAFLALLVSSLCLQAAEADFQPVAALFNKHCLDCHGVQDPEGKLVLETHELLIKGGESGPAVVPGKSSQSLLVRMIEGKFEKEGKVRFMPPGKREKLSASEIQTIRDWIDAGAPGPKAGVAVTKEIAIPKIAPSVAVRRSIQSMAYEAKGKLLAVGRHGEVELHSAESQSLVRTLPGPAGNVSAAAFSPDGKNLYAAGGDAGFPGEIRQWNVADGALVRTVAGHNDSIYGMAVSPDGKLLATGSYDQKIKIWDAVTGAEVRTLSGHNGCVYALAFRPDGKILASASGDRTVKLWDVATGERRDTLSQPLKEQYALAFNANGRRLAAGGVDRRIRVWEISDEARETTNPLLHSKFGHEGSILRLAFSADGKSLLSSAEDKSVKIWNADAMQEKLALERQPDWASGIAFILDGRAVAVGRFDGSLAFHDATSGKVIPAPKPELAGVEPRGVKRGPATKVRLTGKHLERATGVVFGDARLKGRILAEPVPEPNQLWIEVSSDAAMPRGAHTLALSSASGDSGSLKFYIDDLPQLIEGEQTLQQIEALPVTIWGAHRESGDIDTFEFAAQAGRTLVFDAAAKSLGSKADLVLSIADVHGRVLESNNGFDKTGDPLIAHRFAESGSYRLLVKELVPGGSGEHFYRVSIGEFSFATAAHPLVLARGETNRVSLVGYNLPANQVVEAFVSEDDATAALALDPEKLRWRGEFKLSAQDRTVVLEEEPNNSHSEASPLSLPALAAGQLAPGDTEDWFRFEAKAGQTWIVETAAQQHGSPMDTRLEIRDGAGLPVTRVLLQAVRDSAVTFRGIDSVTVDCRVENWEEMELNQYLYLQGEVVRLFRAPQGPDSGFNFYGANGGRRTYFDTTASAHANAEPCYIVEPHPPGARLAPNGLPVFPVFFENDDDAERKLGSDSKVYFTAPKDGVYTVRVTDTRGFNGDRFLYTLSIREARPDFKISVDGMNPTIPKGSGQRFALNVDRIDGFDDEIRVEISDAPKGITISNPIIVQAGHSAAFGTIHAAEDADPPTDAIHLRATAQLRGETVQREIGSLGKITLAPAAPLFVTLEPEKEGIPEIVIAPGGAVPARLKIRRQSHTELVTFQVENLPHGIIVDNIGLNGVLIPKDQNEREIFFAAAKWVPETDRLCYAVANEAGRQTSRPVLIKVRRAAQVANK